jgi:hypothetical protein
MYGHFDSEDGEVTFRGKIVEPTEGGDKASDESQPKASFGIVLSDIAISDGSISADVEFASITDDSICELAVAYDVNARHFLTAGLGGDRWTMFDIREFGGQREGSWTYHQSKGDRANLKAGRVYSLEVQYLGAITTLSIDGVPVGTAVASTPVGRPRQVGLFCRGTSDIKIRNFRVSIAKPRAFAIMQFTSEYDDVYQDVVKEIAGGYQLSIIRADEVTGPGFVIADIIQQISVAQLVIADISPANPNVYFEVGYALALGKPTILLARRGTSLPFDVAGFRVLFYEDSIGGKKKLEQGLRDHLEAILRS